MDVIALDCEVTTKHKGNPFDTNNFFVLGAIGTDNDYTNFTYYDDTLDKRIRSAKMVVLFNGKFDLHWMRNIGMDIDPRMPVS